jgi:hypothetical protein
MHPNGCLPTIFLFILIPSSQNTDTKHELMYDTYDFGATVAMLTSLA